MEEQAALTPRTRAKVLALAEEVAAHNDVRPDDGYARITIEQAIKGALEGNSAIGSVMVDPDGRIILRERNRMFYPRFRSDFHAEMVLLTRYENDLGNHADLSNHTLVSSMEPCEMCTIRIINSGVTTTLFVASAGRGGVTGPNRLSSGWARLAESQTFAAADCSPRLTEIGRALADMTYRSTLDRLMSRRNR